MDQTNLITQYLNHCQHEKNLSENSLKAYTLDIKHFREFIKIKSTMPIHKISKHLLKEYIEHLQNHFKIKTVKRKVASIKAFYNYLVYEEFIETSPFHRLKLRLKEPFKLPTVLYPNEINEILLSLNHEYISHINSDDFKKFSALRNKVIIEMLLNTGLRVSELCNLKVKDVCFDSKYIKVDGKGKKQRQIYIVADHLVDNLVALNKHYLTQAPNRKYFFMNKRGKRYSEQSVRNMLSRHADIKNKHVTPHTLRHTFATILLEEGVDIVNIQHLLGHHSIVVTQIYTHINMKKQREILIDKLPVSQLSISNAG